MWRIDGASWQYCRPAGVALGFQVSVHSVEPSVGNSRANLLSIYSVRAALADEVEPDWPEVTVIFPAFLFSSTAERLAGAASCPDWLIFRPSGKLQSNRPTSDSGEEMALSKLSKFIWLDVGD
jgi:hypothetical protein